MTPGRTYAPTTGSSGVAVPARLIVPTSSVHEDPELVRAERDELRRRLAAVPRVTQNAAVQFAESEKALKAIRLARDAVIERSTELSSKLLKAQEQIAILTDGQELAELARDAAIKQLQAAQLECSELRKKFAEATALRAIPADSDPDPNASGEEKLAELARTQKQLVAAKHAKARQKESVAHLIEQFSEERSRLQQQLSEANTRADTHIAALQAQLAADTRDSVPVAELESDRLEVAGLRVELDSLREEQRRARVPAPASQGEATAVPAQPEEITPPSQSAQLINEIIAEEVQIELFAMERVFAEIAKDPSHLEAVDVLTSQFQDIAQRVLAADCLAAHRVAATCTDVTAWLRKTPKKIAATIPQLEEACTLISDLLRNEIAGRVSDPGGASVYAVDNDVDNCECIAMALEKVALQTRYAMNPDVALADLAKGPCDLIILDVDLGVSDGFELHEQIRQLEHHRTTPVIFVSGLMSSGERIAGLTGAQFDSFVPKPYHLNELALKAIGTILASRLNRL